MDYPCQRGITHVRLRAENVLEEKEMTTMKKHILTITALLASTIGVAGARELTL